MDMKAYHIKDLWIRRDYDNGQIYFRFEVPLEESEACQLQKIRGYHPNGYGFGNFNVDGLVTTWSCSDSCR